MKLCRLIIFVLITGLLLTGCPSTRTDISRQEIIYAYEAAGYQVWSGTYGSDMEYGIRAYLQANHPNGDYIYFTFFDTVEDAKAYEEALDHPVMMALFSVIFGDPMWVRTRRYGCIVVEYWNSDLLEPFNRLRIE